MKTVKGGHNRRHKLPTAPRHTAEGLFQPGTLAESWCPRMKQEQYIANRYRKYSPLRESANA